MGRRVALAAAENLTPVTLELGGKSPALFDADADFGSGLPRLFVGKLLNAGQTCIAPDYALVPQSRLDEFVDAAAASVRALYPDVTGQPGLLVDRQPAPLRAADRAASRTRAAKARASSRSLPPAPRDAGYPRRLPPTLVADVTDDMTIMREEIFGPLLPVETYATLDDAIARINARPHPLALYWFGQRSRASRARAARDARRRRDGQRYALALRARRPAVRRRRRVGHRRVPRRARLRDVLGHESRCSSRRAIRRRACCIRRTAGCSSACSRCCASATGSPRLAFHLLRSSRIRSSSDAILCACLVHLGSPFDQPHGPAGAGASGRYSAYTCCTSRTKSRVSANGGTRVVALRDAALAGVVGGERQRQIVFEARRGDRAGSACRCAGSSPGRAASPRPILAHRRRVRSARRSSGSTCINPTAPLAERARGSNADSTAITAFTSAGIEPVGARVSLDQRRVTTREPLVGRASIEPRAGERATARARSIAGPVGTSSVVSPLKKSL